MRDERTRHHTKKGPGRYHGQGTMVMIRPMFTDIRLVRPPQRRLAPTIHGVPGYFMTYAEHDRCVRHALSIPADRRASKLAYELMASHINAENVAREANAKPARTIETQVEA